METGTGTRETTDQDRYATRKRNLSELAKGICLFLSQSASIKKTAEKQGKPVFKCDLLIMPCGASPGGA